MLSSVFLRPANLRPVEGEPKAKQQQTKEEDEQDDDCSEGEEEEAGDDDPDETSEGFLAALIFFPIVSRISSITIAGHCGFCIANISLPELYTYTCL